MQPSAAFGPFYSGLLTKNLLVCVVKNEQNLFLIGERKLNLKRCLHPALWIQLLSAESAIVYK